MTTTIDFSLTRIISGLNNRTVFAPRDLDELAASMRDLGQLQAIGLRRVLRDPAGQVVPVLTPAAACAWDAAPDSLAQLVYGERRYRACAHGGFATVRAELMNLTNAQALARMYAENAKRAQIDPIDEGAGYQHHVDQGYTIHPETPTSPQGV